MYLIESSKTILNHSLKERESVIDKLCRQLFQERFKSEPVETEEYFLAVSRDIYQNPIKAGLCKKAKEYKWGSYSECLTQARLVDVDFGEIGFLMKF